MRIQTFEEGSLGEAFGSPPLAKIAARSYPRKELAQRLSHYQQEIGNDSKVQANLAHLAEEKSVCVVTGQQLGLFCGPAYTILKGISCLIAARRLGAVPVFWLATEDHDKDEVNHTYRLDSFGNLQKLSLALGKEGVPAEDWLLSARQASELNQMAGLLSIQGEVGREGERFALAMARLIARLFAGTGLLFLEPYLLKELAIPFFQKQIELSCELAAALPDGPLVTDGSPNLFVKDREGRRIKVTGDPHSLMEEVQRAPERFSTNVISRPLLQSDLIPTASYIAGPSELVYLRQLAPLHRALKLPMPALLPRLSASFLPSFAADWLASCGLSPWDPLPSSWEELFPQSRERVGRLKKEWQKLAEEQFGSSAARLARGAVRPVEKALVAKELKARNLQAHSLHFLRNLLHPKGKRQERLLNWWAIQGESSENLVKVLLNQLDTIPNAQLFCTL